MVARSWTAACAATSAAMLMGKGGIARRRSVSDFSRAMTAPRRRAARPAAFENVRALKRLGYWLIQDVTLAPENSTYASSMTTAVCVAALRIFLIASGWRSVPVGLLGLAMKRTRGFLRRAAQTPARGNSISEP